MHAACTVHLSLVDLNTTTMIREDRSVSKELYCLLSFFVISVNEDT